MYGGAINRAERQRPFDLVATAGRLGGELGHAMWAREGPGKILRVSPFSSSFFRYFEEGLSSVNREVNLRSGSYPSKNFPTSYITCSFFSVVYLPGGAKKGTDRQVLIQKFQFRSQIQPKRGIHMPSPVLSRLPAAEYDSRDPKGTFQGALVDNLTKITTGASTENIIYANASQASCKFRRFSPSSNSKGKGKHKRSIEPENWQDRSRE